MIVLNQLSKNKNNKIYFYYFITKNKLYKQNIFIILFNLI